ncbi:ATP-binding protein [Natranaerofaba carboxydovora]|uniref:ATP-binding protein n=1 Tax=Natranaerofaba carboxydovora TaxID=2742683 RepID=UPI001F13AFD5|nr:ATP-binding protein [Natranaerofaba carboxydovora]UMZ74275.1 Histidine kinase-like ATPase domain protein [Natranaerofaba carboxydovora]
MIKKISFKQDCRKCPYGTKLRNFYNKFNFIPNEIYKEIFESKPFTEEINKNKYRFKFKSCLMKLEKVKEKLQKLNLDYDNKFVVTQAFHELMINAIEHGNKNDSDKTVTVNLVVANEYIILTVKDNGNGFNWTRQINKNLSLESANETGKNLGLTITKMLCDDIFFNNTGNKAILFFYNKNKEV